MTPDTVRTNRMMSDFLAAAKSRPVPAQAETDAGDYDWDSPSIFTLDELENLEKFAAQAGIEISKALSGQIREQVELQSDKPGQYYAEKLPLLDSEAVNYCVALTTDGGPNCGLIAIPVEQTIEWITKVLGGSTGASAQDRELSSLESALLQDILASVAKAFSGAFQQVGGKAVQAGKEIIAKAELPEANRDDEYILLSFRTGQEAERPAISIVLTGEILAPAAGASGGKQDNESPESIRKKMLANVEQAHVEGHVRLGAANLTIREVMSLEEGDVLLINKKIDEPVEFIVQGKAIMSGYPVRCEGQYALRIAKPTGRAGGKRKAEMNRKAPTPAPLPKKGQN